MNVSEVVGYGGRWKLLGFGAIWSLLRIQDRLLLLLIFVESSVESDCL